MVVIHILEKIGIQVDNMEYISKCGEYKLVIEQDDYAESPNDWGNEDLFLVYSHRDFTAKRDGFEPQHIYQHLKAKEGIDYYNSILKNGDVLSSQQTEDLEYYKHDYVPEYEDYYIFPVAAYIHSDVSLSLANSFHTSEFDTSVTGFALVKKEKDLVIQKAKLQAENLLDMWNQYLSGDVYGYTLYGYSKVYKINADDYHNLASTYTMSVDGGFKSKLLNAFEEEIEWGEIDSCWGFYGDDIKTNGILDHIDSEIEFEL